MLRPLWLGRRSTHRGLCVEFPASRYFSVVDQNPWRAQHTHTSGVTLESSEEATHRAHNVKTFSTEMPAKWLLLTWEGNKDCEDSEYVTDNLRGRSWSTKYNGLRSTAPTLQDGYMEKGEFRFDHVERMNRDLDDACHVWWFMEVVKPDCQMHLEAFGWAAVWFIIQQPLLRIQTLLSACTSAPTADM